MSRQRQRNEKLLSKYRAMHQEGKEDVNIGKTQGMLTFGLTVLADKEFLWRAFAIAWRRLQAVVAKRPLWLLLQLLHLGCTEGRHWRALGGGGSTFLLLLTASTCLLHRTVRLKVWAQRLLDFLQKDKTNKTFIRSNCSAKDNSRMTRRRWRVNAATEKHHLCARTDTTAWIHWIYSGTCYQRTSLISWNY